MCDGHSSPALEEGVQGLARGGREPPYMGSLASWLALMERRDSTACLWTLASQDPGQPSGSDCGPSASLRNVLEGPVPRPHPQHTSVGPGRLWTSVLSDSDACCSVGTTVAGRKSTDFGSRHT